MKILEPAKEIEIAGQVDVCVIGGSCTGVFAAVRVAQMGLKVAIIEKQNCFGGVATSGLVHIWHSLYDTELKTQIIGGLTADMLSRLKKRNAVLIDEKSYSSAYKMNTEELKIELDCLIEEYGITPYLHTHFAGVLYEQDKITAVFIENKDGRQAIKADFFIDATGDGDLCRSVGLGYYMHEHSQPPTACAKIFSPDNDGFSNLIAEHYEEFGLKKDWGWSNTIPNIENIRMHAETHVFDVNCAKASDLTYSEMEGRKQIRAVMDIWRKYSPVGKDITLMALPSYIGIRETYHINALHKIKSDELLYGTRFDDAIGNGSYRVDTHHATGSGITFKYLSGVMEVIPEAGQPGIFSRWREEMDTDPTFYQIPYRSLVPDGKIGNLLFAGRMIDAEKEAYSALRVMVNCNQMGEAVGVAAAIAVKEKVKASEVDVKLLRSKLSEMGAVII